MEFDNSTVKLNISDIKKKFKVWDGMRLEIFIDSDVKIGYTNGSQNENNTQNITPTTNLEGETRSGKINKGLTDIHLEDDTTGSETRRGCNNDVLLKDEVVKE